MTARLPIATLVLTLVAAAFAAHAQEQAGPWSAIPATATFTTGDSWIHGGETYRLYGVQACLRGTAVTNVAGARIDCGEASLAMLVALIRDLQPRCYTAARQASTRTRFVVCLALLQKGEAAGSRIDLATALISTGWAFAAITSSGAPIHPPYIVAQEFARKQRRGLWQFEDVPDPNRIILKTIRNAPGNQDPFASQPVAPATRQ